MASAPTFCDTSRGLWLVFTVEVSGGAELVAVQAHKPQIQNIPVEEVARLAGTIALELLAAISPRVSRQVED